MKRDFSYSTSIFTANKTPFNTMSMTLNPTKTPKETASPSKSPTPAPSLDPALLGWENPIDHISPYSWIGIGVLALVVVSIIVVVAICLKRKPKVIVHRLEGASESSTIYEYTESSYEENHEEEEHEVNEENESLVLFSERELTVETGENSVYTNSRDYGNPPEIIFSDNSDCTDSKLSNECNGIKNHNISLLIL